MSRRPFCTKAGMPVRASTTRWMLGRTLQRRHPTRRGPGSGRPDQVEQVGALGLVELERTADSLEDIIRHAAGVAALEARVVLHAGPRQQRDLLAPQTRHPALAAIERQTRTMRRDLRAARREELKDLACAAHAPLTVRPCTRGWEALPVPL